MPAHVIPPLESSAFVLEVRHWVYIEVWSYIIYLELVGMFKRVSGGPGLGTVVCFLPYCGCASCHRVCCGRDVRAKGMAVMQVLLLMLSIS